MKPFTLILATAFLLAISSVSFAQTSTSTYNVSENIQILSIKGSIKFNPLGIADGFVKIKMSNQPKGVYNVKVMDANGTILETKKINHLDSTEIEVADFGRKFPGGTYQLEVISPDNTKTDQTIMLLI